MSFTLTGTNLDAPDAGELAGFSRRLLGWSTEVDEPGWVVLRPTLPAPCPCLADPRHGRQAC